MRFTINLVPRLFPLRERSGKSLGTRLLYNYIKYHAYLICLLSLDYFIFRTNVILLS